MVALLSPACITGTGDVGGSATAPQVLEIWPPDGAGDVDPQTRLRVRFDRPMDPDSLLGGFELRAGAALSALKVLYISESREALLLPRRPLEERIRYTLSVRDSVASHEGVPLAAPVSSELLTGVAELGDDAEEGG